MVAGNRRRQGNEIIQSVAFGQQLAHGPQSVRGIRVATLPAAMGTHPPLGNGMGISTFKMLYAPQHTTAHHLADAKMPGIVAAVLKHHTMPASPPCSRHEPFAISNGHCRGNLQGNILACLHGSNSHTHVPLPRSTYPHQVHLGMSGGIAPVAFHIALDKHIGIWQTGQALQSCLPTLTKTYKRDIYHTIQVASINY